MKNFKRLLSLVLVAAMLLSCCIFANAGAYDTALVSSNTLFKDMPDDWSTEALRFNIGAGILTGYEDNTVRASRYMTRAEMAAIINRAFGATVMAEIDFNDVSNTEWFYNDIAKAYNMGSFIGSGEKIMQPNAPIRREDVFLAVARVMVLSGGDKNVLKTFDDYTEIDSWAVDAVATLVEKGYIKGNNENKLHPTDYITRAEFSQFIYNIFKTYFTAAGTYDSVNTEGSVMIRGKDVTLKNVVINGDLVLGDGVGMGDVHLENVTIKGRLLCRGGGGYVYITNSSVGENVVVNDVNETVNFYLYRSNVIFDSVAEHTPATYLQDTPSSGGGTVASKTVTFAYATALDRVVRERGYERTRNKLTQAQFNNHIPYDITNTDRAFAGWYDEEGNLYTADTVIARNVTVHPKWYDNETLAADVTFRHVDGTNDFNVMTLSAVPIKRNTDTFVADLINLIGTGDLADETDRIFFDGEGAINGYLYSQVLGSATSEYKYTPLDSLGIIQDITNTISGFFGDNIDDILMAGVRKNAGIYAQYQNNPTVRAAIDSIIQQVSEDSEIDVKIDPSNSNYWGAVKFFKNRIAELDYETNIKGYVSSKYTAFFSDEQIEAFFERTQTKYVADLTAAIAAVTADPTATVTVSLDVAVNPVDDIYTPFLTKLADDTAAAGATSFSNFVRNSLTADHVFVAAGGDYKFKNGTQTAVSLATAATNFNNAATVTAGVTTLPRATAAVIALYAKAISAKRRRGCPGRISAGTF